MDRACGLFARCSERVTNLVEGIEWEDSVQADDMDLLAPVKLTIVSFRYDPGGLSEEELDVVNRSIGQGFEADGRVLAGTTLFEGRVAHRPAFSNWRTRAEDVELYVQVVRELGEAAVRALRG